MIQQQQYIYHIFIIITRMNNRITKKCTYKTFFLTSAPVVLKISMTFSRVVVIFWNLHSSLLDFPSFPQILEMWSPKLLLWQRNTKYEKDQNNMTYMKNCEPFVSLPRFAIDNRNSLSWFRIKFSSAHTIFEHVHICTYTYCIQQLQTHFIQPLNSAHKADLTASSTKQHPRQQ